jgi:hypothetical protein
MLPVNEDGVPIITQSLVNSWMDCPVNVYYRYIKGLSPKNPPEHIIRGVWIHECLEEYYKTGSWRAKHEEWVSKYPTRVLAQEIDRTLTGYAFYYESDDMDVLATELPLEGDLPCGYKFYGKLDAIARMPDGRRLIVDHKTTKRIKPMEQQILQIQAPMYMWLCDQNGLEVDGFLWNYLVTPGPQPPKFAGKGTRLASRQPQTDYPTALETVRRARDVYGSAFTPNKRHADEVSAMLDFHREVRIGGKHAEASQLYKRRSVPRSDQWVGTVVDRVDRTAQAMWRQDWSDEGQIPVAPNAYWSPTADYLDLVTAYMMTGSSDLVATQRYTRSNPMERYE